jgi:hypothetical protein
MVAAPRFCLSVWRITLKFVTRIISRRSETLRGLQKDTVTHAKDSGARRIFLIIKLLTFPEEGDSSGRVLVNRDHPTNSVNVRYAPGSRRLARSLWANSDEVRCNKATAI